MKNKDNGIVLFNGKYESPLWSNPYKIVDSSDFNCRIDKKY